MLRRLLKIASIVCLVACVVLMWMRVRSYYWMDDFNFNPFGSVVVVGGSAIGRIAVGATSMTSARSPGFAHSRIANRASELAAIDQHWSTFAGFGFIDSYATGIMVPYWFAIVVTGALGLAPWSRVKYRFGLRSLFIVTTVLAIVLGMIAWLDRAWIGK